MKLKTWTTALLFLTLCVLDGNCQVAAPQRISHSSSLTFEKLDGTCIVGQIAKVNASAITVQQYGKPSAIIQRSSLLEISQGNALLFTSLNSWSNVEKESANVYPREEFVLKLKKGNLEKGKPIKVTPDSISLKHGFTKTDYKKSEIATVDYLRLAPESDAFDNFSQEAPFLLFFDPEFYYRAMGLEGRILVRLWNDAKPETNGAPRCSS